MFDASTEGKIKILVSNLVIKEITKICSIKEEELKKFLLLTKVIVVSVKNCDVGKARDISKKYKLHLKDAIHAAVAIRTRCNVFVTRDLKDFQKISELILVLKPEDLNF